MIQPAAHGLFRRPDGPHAAAGSGEHSREVLAEFGHAAAEIDGLIEAGVVGE